MTEPEIASCWFLTGATAVGKTAVAMQLADRLGAEVLSMDSMAVYRGMDIGTAKPSLEQQARVRHHLIDLLEPEEEFSVAQYRGLALERVREVASRGKPALFVGGTPLYLKCLLRGLFDGPAANPALRAEIEAELAATSPSAGHARLQQCDPLAASQIHPNDTRRIVRALEVYLTTGTPISHQQAEFEEGAPAAERRVFVLRRDRAEEHRRIEARVRTMLEAGLVDEVRGLTSGGRCLGPTASQAVGYQEVLEHLAGAADWQTMREKIEARTRRFAKRQGTWFRSLSECRFLDIDNRDPADVAEEIATAGEGGR